VAEATLRLATIATGAQGELRPDIKFSDRMMSTYARIATTSAVLDDVRARLRLDAEPAIEAVIPANSELIRIRGQANDPGSAANIANAGAMALQRRSAGIASQSPSSTRELRASLREASASLARARSRAQQTRDQPALHAVALSVVDLRQARFVALQNQVNLAGPPSRGSALRMLERAKPPADPQFPSRAGGSLIGALLGLLAGAAAAIHGGNSRRRLRAARDLDKSGVPVLGTLSRVGRPPGSADHGGTPPALHLPLRTTARALAAGTRVVVVASPERAEGTTTVIAYLAAAVAADGHSVVAVDANRRSPSLHRMLGVGNAAGLADVLVAPGRLEEAIKRTGLTNLDVLTFGFSQGGDTAEMLTGERMGALIAALCQRYDHVLIDAPPVLDSADAMRLAALSDGVVLVVRVGRSRLAAITAANDDLSLVGAKRLGIILNDPSAPAGTDATAIRSSYVSGEESKG
jgi:capsular exopolysaccharide synthesis family protein